MRGKKTKEFQNLGFWSIRTSCQEGGVMGVGGETEMSRKRGRERKEGMFGAEIRKKRKLFSFIYLADL